MTRSRVRRVPLPALALAALLGSSAPLASSEPPQAPASELHGIGRGILLRLEPNFRWKGNEEARHGILGTLEGTTREFETISIEFGVDRVVFTAAQRSALEAYRIQREGGGGQSMTPDVKPDLSLVRMKSLSQDAVFACAVKQVGRTVVYARGNCERKDEAGLVKLVKAIVSGASAIGDEVDGWIPKEVKATWNRTPSADLIAVDDGTVDAPRREEILRAVRIGHGAAKRLLGSTLATPFLPVVRITTKRDMFSYLAARRDLRDMDAVYVPWAGELLVSPRGAELDVRVVAREAAAQAVHHVLGAADGEPVLSGLMRQAVAEAEGLAPGSLLPEDEERAYARVKAKEAKSWYRTLMLPTLVGYLSEDGEERALDSELAVVYLASPGAAIGKASLAAWVASFKKTGHPDAASGAAVGAMDPAKCDAEYWAYWGPRADPPKKGDGKTPPKPPTKPAPQKPKPGSK